ncbi:GGDEF domain-containing protein [Thiosulfativibrio zosterae]|uniref:diguanylate cyclase n=1 Tax=Thiosulfativibrio zosterae TaxID=2675053 RepID=A0A6F8PKS5_9GAMM|nr:GGDEF domain-containing protein [Thiosulfativibrio zosterae]BBP42600.1 hypothetical protein THMIRHAT_03460 [Thiosulfativibrio zosterae]
MNFTLTWRYWILLIMAWIVPAVVMVPFYQSDRQSVSHKVFTNYQEYLGREIKTQIDSKQHSNLVLATALSHWPSLISVLENDAPVSELHLNDVSTSLALNTRYKNVWIQVVDAKGVSRLRSWTDKKGDSLIEVRKELADLIKHPRVDTAISIGKFALSLKSIVPLYGSQKQFLGFVEVITQFNSIDYDLRKQEHLMSMLLINRPYLDQLSRLKAIAENEGYLLTNHAAGEPEKVFLQSHSVDDLVRIKDYKLIDGQFVASYPIRDGMGEVLAYWLMVKHIEAFDWHEFDNLDSRYLWGYFFIASLMFLLVLLVFFKRKADFERLFFYQIFNHAQEVVFVSDRKGLVKANQAFFDLFNEFKTLEEFHNTYRCVCDTFVKEEGYLQEHMGDLYWYDYILQNTDMTHQAKIQYRDKTFIMTVTASNIMQAHQESGLVSILMADVTEQELYKKELEHITIHDDLTGLRNRHYFNQRIDEEIQRSQRYQNPLSLISFDIDHFKQVNDTYGHDVGDLVLKKVARECSPYIRETDALCRVGGEEFMVIMPETKLEDAALIAERLRMAIQNMSLGNLELPVTISLGVVELSHVENFTLLYKRADQALYAAKDKGRNCVVVG